MQQEFLESFHRPLDTRASASPPTTSQDGFHQLRPCGSAPDHHAQEQWERPGSASPPRSLGSAADAVNADQLEKRLRRLSVEGRPQAPGHRISEYENALTPLTPRKPMGFKVIKRADANANGPQLTDFPNEILTHILSHLHPDSHSAVALVSKRFYSLVTTPHAWRLAFQRFFPGQEALSGSGTAHGTSEHEAAEFIRSEVRQFNRLTAHASWRSEYLLRTRLLRSLTRGKPGSTGSGGAVRTQSGKKLSAVLTYNSKLPSVVTNIHASFNSSSKKAPRVIHGAADLDVCSASDPTNGKVEKWGLDDPFAFAQLDEVVPQILPYGVGEGPAAVPNVMDVSQAFGVVGGEGFPGGRVFYRPYGVYRGKYIGQEPNIVDAHPDIPKIPELSEGVCSLWIAKSPAVPSLTQSMVGILTGSSLGVVTAFSLGHDSSGPRYAGGEITARWVLSPGVPVVAIQVDDGYTQKRKTAGRVWAVALNALGEVYYLKEPPTPVSVKSKAEDATKCAWHAGRSTYWHLVESTRRQARSDDSGKNAVRGAYSPRSPSNAMDLTREQMVAEAREIERFLKYKPSHFRKVCHGWDMRRRLEVDFTADDERGAGEGIFVIECGFEDGQPAGVTRFVRVVSGGTPPDNSLLVSPGDTSPGDQASPSLFGGSPGKSWPPIGTSPSPLLKQALASGAQSPLNPGEHKLDDWRETKLSLPSQNCQITTSCLDMSLCGLMTSFEDPLKEGTNSSPKIPSSPTGQPPSDIPGRRARMLGIGDNQGTVVLWNMRENHASDGLQPVRLIQTESPEISSLAISALYLVHGGSDGLVQAWDPLASTLDPIRTLNSRSTGRIPRHIITANPALRHNNFAAVGAIHLDPDPTVLRGIVCFGTFVRYWAYSSTGQPAGRKRRVRHSEVHGRQETRRYGGGVKGYIASEAEDMRLEQEHQAQEKAHLRARFGVGMADLTEEEAIQYAALISQESFLVDEQRRTSASETGSTFDTTSTSWQSLETVTPDPSVTGKSPPAAGPSMSNDAGGDESDYELQIQQALRLSLLEGVNGADQSPPGGNSSGDFDFPITFKEKRGGKQQSSSSASPFSSHTPSMTQYATTAESSTSPEMDDDLRLALELSLAEEESRKASLMGFYEGDGSEVGGIVAEEQFPALDAKGKGKKRAF